MYRVGDPVVYTISKTSVHPGPRAKRLRPAPLGETYSYRVDKFWTVAGTEPDGKLRLRTRRGKEHLVTANDPLLRHPTWWERFLHRDRFPRLEPREDG